MNQTRGDKIALFQIILLDSVDSILSAKEYTKLKSNLSRAERKKIQMNFSEIALIAATDLVDNIIESDNMELTDEQIIRAFSLAVLVFLENERA